MQAGATHRPFDISHRGLSGTNQIMNTCSTDGKPWSAEGMRHDQLLGIWNVPKVVQAAMMLPRNLFAISEHSRNRTSSHQKKDVPQRVVQRRCLRSLRRERHLGDEQRGGGRGEAAAEAEQEASRVISSIIESQVMQLLTEPR